MLILNSVLLIFFSWFFYRLGKSAGYEKGRIERQENLEIEISRCISDVIACLEAAGINFSDLDKAKEECNKISIENGLPLKPSSVIKAAIIQKEKIILNLKSKTESLQETINDLLLRLKEDDDKLNNLKLGIINLEVELVKCRTYAEQERVKAEKTHKELEKYKALEKQFLDAVTKATQGPKFYIGEEL